MGRLATEQKARWKKALASCEAPWIICGVDPSLPRSERLLGMAGILDWHLHGQVSRLFVRGVFAPGEFCLVPWAGKNFLFHHFKGTPAPLIQRLRSLRADNIAVAASTFPEDFLSDLKENLRKEGIRWTKLESEPT